MILLSHSDAPPRGEILVSNKICSIINMASSSTMAPHYTCCQRSATVVICC